MSKVGLWHIQSDRPVKLKEVSLDLEKNLEEWIEQDTSLVQNGLVIVSRQIIFEGGRLDLLALDPLGRWVVIEIKAGAVRNETIAQALYYSAILSHLPTADLHQKVDDYLKPRGMSLAVLLKERGIEPLDAGDSRELLIMLVGTHQASGLNRVVEHLVSDYKFPISVITFDIHQTLTGERILTRELTEEDTYQTPSTGKTKKPLVSIDGLVSKADMEGAGDLFRRMRDAADRHGFYARTYANSVMYAPPQNHTRMLFTVWVGNNKKDMLKTYIGHSAFAEYYPVTEEEALAFLGPEGWSMMDQAGVEKFIYGLDQMFAKIDSEKLLE